MIRYDKQALCARMATLQQNLPEVEAAAVISVDGLIMASALPQNISEDRISAMSAAMLSLGERIAGGRGHARPGAARSGGAGRRLGARESSAANGSAK